MSTSPSQPHSGPMHLQPYLEACPPEFAKVIQKTASRAPSNLQRLYCPCRASAMLQKIDEDEASDDPAVRESARQRKEALNRHKQERMQGGSSSRLMPATRAGSGRRPDSGRSPDTNLKRTADPHESPDPAKRVCHLFSLETNEEEGVVRAFCRRCLNLYPLFDRALYWGVRRKDGRVPPTYQFRCPCGGHTFEMGLGFEYPDEPLDENDISTITIAAKCLACGEISLVTDEEAE